MGRIKIALFFVLGVLVCASAQAQCRGGGGGGQGGGSGGGTTTASGGTTAAGGELLTGPGSWAYDVMVAQQMQLMAARQQYLLAQQKAAEKQKELEQRRYWSVNKRQEIADRRQRMRVFLGQHDSSATGEPAAFQTALVGRK